MKKEKITPLKKDEIEFFDYIVRELNNKKEYDLAKVVRMYVNRKRGYAYK